ncbi:MAG: hypothetical protein B7Y39_08310 [Bdellovibrio sp. 28-41-41]|nr:MAG: hypothetical protein B7Y39_08310 [Bdellovibrio sp. 28-41-41]
MLSVVKSGILVLLATTLVHAEEINLSGMYVVPTNDPELTLASQFKVSDYKVIEPNSKQPTIQFTLPVELTGVSKALVFKRQMVIDAKENTSLFTSASGSALCYGAWKSLKCFFKFKNLTLDPVKAEATMANVFQGLEFTQKVALMNRFMGEPVGILQIDTSIDTDEAP